MSRNPTDLNDLDGQLVTIAELSSDGVERTSALVVIFGKELSEEPDADDLEELEQLRLELLAEDECDDETNQLDREAQAREEHNNETS